MILQLIFFAILAWLLHVHLDQKRKAVNLPGPKGWPIFGYLFHMDKQMYVTFSKLSQKYGKAWYFNIFNEHFVSIGDVKLAKELYSLDQINGRPQSDLFLIFEGEYLGLLSSEGALWESHRRFSLRQLRDFGFGKGSMEALIMDEVHEFVNSLKQKKGTPVGGVKERFSLAVINSLWSVVSGNRYSQDDPKIRAIANSLSRTLTATAESGGIVFFFPWLRYIIPEYCGYKATRDAFEQLKEFVLESVEEHKKTFQPELCRDFIDVYLKEINSQKDPQSTFYGKEAEKQLAAVIGDLFFAGTDTTSTTLAWAILYLATYQDVQKKLYEEISSVTGNTRDVSVTDRQHLPYLLGTIDEILRKSSIIPTGVNHRVTTGVTHRGVNYKTGTNVGINAHYIHHNPEIWGDPENFRPERFLTLDDNGLTSYKRNENVVAFSVKRRQCIGEPLARDTLYLFIGNIVRNFHLDFETPSDPKPSLEPAVGFALNPQEYQVCFQSRSG